MSNREITFCIIFVIAFIIITLAIEICWRLLKPTQTHSMVQAELELFRVTAELEILEEFLSGAKCPHCDKKLDVSEFDEDQCQACGGLTPCHCHEEGPC